MREHGAASRQAAPPLSILLRFFAADFFAQLMKPQSTHVLAGCTFEIQAPRLMDQRDGKHSQA
jgi:hypothetical protein